VVATARAVGIEINRLDTARRSGNGLQEPSFLMLPAGEMWSVVTESPKIARQLMSFRFGIPGSVSEKFSK
jgi:hypothetical protein